MTPAIPTSSPQLPQRLAEATLPRRVRVILDHVMDVASDELEHLLQAMLDEQEQHLFRLADHARNPGVESEYLHTLRTLRLKQERFDEVFADVRVMERAALAEMNKD